MSIASRTPEGFPIRCAVCRAESRIEPSLPPGDAVCPRCGQLVWTFAVMELIARLCQERGISPDLLRLDMALDELGCDSIAFVELVMELEEDFDLNVSDQAAGEIRTIGDLLRLLMEWGPNDEET